MTDYPGPDAGPTTTTTDPPGPAGPPTIRRFRRSRNDRVLAGVSGGLAESLAMDPVIIRVLLVVLTFFGGAGIIVYLACWLLMPEDDRESSLAERAIARGGRTSWPLLVLAGAIGLAAVLSAGWVVDDRGLLLIALFVIAAILLSRRERDLTAPPVTTPPPAPFPSGPTPAAAPWTAGAWTPTEPLPPLPPLPAPPPPAPRSLLGRITFALVLLGLGVLAAVDLAGADVPAAAYPALVVAGAGLGLLVGTRSSRWACSECSRCPPASSPTPTAATGWTRTAGRSSRPRSPTSRRSTPTAGAG
jgi:phage shock protein PspC (stress-responsive transcriptional regulator)